jgi:hypothetical protein
MATLAEIQAELRKRDEEAKARDEKRNTKSSGGDNAGFPFWETKIGEKSVVRYLPDGDDSNVFPWVERQTIELTFDGTINGEVDTTEQVKIKVPCPTMFTKIIPGYNIPCQITAAIRPLWKADKNSADYKQAQKYYRKQSWLTQGFVVSAPFTEENLPENPIRRMTLTKQVFNKVFKAYNGTEFEYAPHDYDQGTDFTIEPTPQGDFKNWEGSDFARRTRSLSAEERAAINEYGLFVLKDFVGKAPTQADADAQYQMYLDSVAGKPYDFAKYNEFYRPYGVKGPNTPSDNTNQNTDSGSTASGTSTPSTPEPKAEVAAPVADAASDVSGGSMGTDDLIARIRRNAMKTD